MAPLDELFSVKWEPRSVQERSNRAIGHCSVPCLLPLKRGQVWIGIVGVATLACVYRIERPTNELCASRSTLESRPSTYRYEESYLNWLVTCLALAKITFTIARHPCQTPYRRCCRIFTSLYIMHACVWTSTYYLLQFQLLFFFCRLTLRFFFKLFYRGIPLWLGSVFVLSAKYLKKIHLASPMYGQ